jgi:hypothetical protein
MVVDERFVGAGDGEAEKKRPDGPLELPITLRREPADDARNPGSERVGSLGAQRIQSGREGSVVFDEREEGGAEAPHGAKARLPESLEVHADTPKGAQGFEGELFGDRVPVERGDPEALESCLESSAVLGKRLVKGLEELFVSREVLFGSETLELFLERTMASFRELAEQPLAPGARREPKSLAGGSLAKDRQETIGREGIEFLGARLAG